MSAHCRYRQARIFMQPDALIAVPMPKIWGTLPGAGRRGLAGGASPEADAAARARGSLGPRALMPPGRYARGPAWRNVGSRPVRA